MQEANSPAGSAGTTPRAGDGTSPKPYRSVSLGRVISSPFHQMEQVRPRLDCLQPACRSAGNFQVREKPCCTLCSVHQLKLRVGEPVSNVVMFLDCAGRRGHWAAANAPLASSSWHTPQHAASRDDVGPGNGAGVAWLGVAGTMHMLYCLGVNRRLGRADGAGISH